MLMKTLPVYLDAVQHTPLHRCATCVTRGSALFGSLDERGLDHVQLRIDSLEIGPDEPIYARGQPGNAVYTVRSGIVRFERATEGGERRIVRLAGPGDLIGMESILSQPYIDDAFACTQVQLCRIPRHTVEDLGENDALSPRELMLRWQRALDDAETWVAELAMGPVRRRLLRLLAKLGQYADEDGMVWLPRREEMGAMLNMAVETASRQISRLRREGVLQAIPPRAARLNMRALEQALRSADA